MLTKLTVSHQISARGRIISFAELTDAELKAAKEFSIDVFSGCSSTEHIDTWLTARIGIRSRHNQTEVILIASP